MKTSFLSKFRVNNFQLFLSCLLIVYLPLLYVKQYKKNLYAEKIPTVFSVDKATQQVSSNVSVGLHINNFHTFSFDKNEFVMDAIVWFKFPIGAESVKTIEEFDIQNGKIIEKSKPIIKLVGDDVIVSYQIVAEFKSYIDYQYFPFGAHRLTIIIDNRTVAPEELTFVAQTENFMLSNDILVTKWQPKGKTVQAGYINSPLSERDSNLSIGYPIAAFTLDFENQSARELVALYFPLFVVFLISLFTLLVDVRYSMERLNIISHSLPIQALDRIVIDNLSPSVGAFTKIDFIYFLLIFLSFVILLFSIYVIVNLQRIEKHECSPEQKERMTDSLSKQNNILFTTIVVALMILATYNALA